MQANALKSNAWAAGARNSSFELLRLIAMFIVVNSHSSSHGGFPIEPSALTLNNVVLGWMKIGEVGLVLFVLISSFFMSQREPTAANVMKLFTQVWFYCLVCLGLGFLFGYPIGLKTLVKELLPTIFSQYWFFTIYMVLFLISPALNKLIRLWSPREYMAALLTMFIIWSLIPTFTAQLMGATDLVQFIMLYFIGAAFWRFPDNPFKRLRVRLLAVLVPLVLVFSSSVIIFLLSERLPMLRGMDCFFFARMSIFVILCATGLFAMAVYAKPFFSPLINRLGACTFGVYLLHENQITRELVWLRWLDNRAYYNSPLLIPRMLLSVLAVYAAGIAVELLRQKFFAGPALAMLNKIYGFAANRLRPVFAYLVAAVENREGDKK